MEREPGFYWTKFNDESDDWEPAAFNGSTWHFIGTLADPDKGPWLVGDRILEPTD
ncbi:hypothetical protein [Sphingomonas jaspsi]|uniref:hypothetical protein n=1 Tax=Sphingomonas jaspsi TaxID=392409 RepID=UPI0004AECB91|nr:hypothetical protein [Sphingomonas jaspsi]